MRIAFLTTEYLNQAYGTGGLASYLLRTTRLLHQMGHDIEVFALAPKDDQRNENGIRVTEVSGQNLPLDWIARTRLLWRAKGWLQRFSGYEDALGRAWKLHRAFCRRHRQQPFDIVQAASSMGCGFFTARRKPVPVVTRASGRYAGRPTAFRQRRSASSTSAWNCGNCSAVRPFMPPAASWSTCFPATTTSMQT